MSKLLASVNIGQEFRLKEQGIGAFETLGSFISAILPNIYILASAILFFLLIFGGFKIIVSAGQENPENTAQGKKAVTAAVIGFIIIFTSYWLLQIIKVVTGIDILGGAGL